MDILPVSAICAARFHNISFNSVFGSVRAVGVHGSGNVSLAHGEIRGRLPAFVIVHVMTSLDAAVLWYDLCL